MREEYDTGFRDVRTTTEVTCGKGWGFVEEEEEGEEEA